VAKLISKIVLTGGPCAGKTSALLKIKETFEKDYKVFIINETATELINSGISPVDLYSVYDFQYFILKNQIYKEKLIEEAIEKLSDDIKCIIICDRGCMDNKAFLNDDEFEKMLRKMNLNEQEILSKYDLVIHLVTIASGNKNKYSNENNQARFHNENEALFLDKKIIEAWKNHSNLKIIDNSTSFENKIQRTIDEIKKNLNHN